MGEKTPRVFGEENLRFFLPEERNTQLFPATPFFPLRVPCPFTENTSLLTLLVQACGGFFPHQAILRHSLGVPQSNSMMTLFTWREHQGPKVKGSVPCDCPHTRHTAGASLGCALCFRPIGRGAELPASPPELDSLANVARRTQGDTYIYQFY